MGLGFWHRADTEALTSLFDPTAPAQTPYRLTSADLAHPDGIELLNMNDGLNFESPNPSPEKHLAWRDKREYTTRIIRIYTRGKQDQVIYDRLDWELKTPEVKWSSRTLDHLEELLRARLNGRSVKAVIIKDMRKGAITGEIIDWLAGLKFDNATWFISSKRWRPAWLEKLGEKVTLSLVMIPQVAAEEALRSRAEKLTRWITRAGRPSKEAITLIDDFAKFTQAKNIIVVPEGFSVLACEYESGSVRDYVVQSEATPERITVDMGYASILFPALVACVSKPGGAMNIEDRLKLATRAAYEWVHYEARRVTEFSKPWEPNPEAWPSTDALKQIKARIHDAANTGEPKTFGNIHRNEWDVARKEWTEALSEVGIVGRDKEKGGGRLELWRAMLEVDGYVCCDESKREQLRHLLRGVQLFSKNPRYHASCMLVASPGSGKTFLAKRLSETANLRFTPFNITQMRSKGDILECLDTIVATQAESDESPLMVFVDEINAQLENATVYGAFLTPLEDGTYVHGGRTFNLRPCLWVFAGTGHPGKSQADQRRNLIQPETPEKGSDFVSRLTLGVIDLSASDGNNDHKGDNIEEYKMHATEKVYLGVGMLRHEFPDVQRVSEPVLRAFWELPQHATVRDIKHFVRRFTDIQYGEVTARSVPDRWPGNDDKDRDRWRILCAKERLSDKADVEIVTFVESERRGRFRLS